MEITLVLNLIILILFGVVLIFILIVKYTELSRRNIILYVFTEDEKKILYSSPSKEQRIGEILSFEGEKCVYIIENTSLSSEIGMKNLVFLQESEIDVSSSVKIHHSLMESDGEIIEMSF